MRRFATLAAAAAVAFATVPASALVVPTGVQNDISLATVAAWGWTECYVSTYATPIGTTYTAALSACSGDKLMLAARATGGTTYDVLAAADYADVTFNTGNNGNTLHVANGVGWYYSANWSWGFADDTDTVNRNSCDVAGSNERDRLCWHMLSNVGGYRSGSNLNLNGSTAFEKVILMANDAPADVPEPAMLGLFGLGALGLGLSRRRA